MKDCGFHFDSETARIEPILAALRSRGLIVVRNAVARDIAISLHQMIEASVKWVASNERQAFHKIRAGFLGSAGHLGILLELSGAAIQREVLLPASVANVIRCYLGDALYLHEWVVNVNLAMNPNSQKVHRDEEVDPLGRECGLVLNIATQRLGRFNGVTEYWLDSHKVAFDQSMDPDGEGLAFESFQPDLEIGDLVLRDLALLHRGVANPDSGDRHFPAIVLNPSWQPLNPRFIRMVPKQEHDRLDEETQSILRFHQVTTRKAFPAAYPLPEDSVE